MKIKRNKIAILWSGGIDSTSVLKQYLEKTNFEIVAIHVNYSVPNMDNRDKFENKAIERLLPELQKIRPFEFSNLDLCFDKNIYSGDMILFAAPAFVLAASQGCKDMILGFTEDNHKNQEFHILDKLFAMNSLCRIIARFDRYKYMCWYRKPKQGIFGHKRHYIEQLGDLLELCHWCRNPSEILPGQTSCGNCQPCRHILRTMETVELENYI